MPQAQCLQTGRIPSQGRGSGEDALSWREASLEPYSLGPLGGPHWESLPAALPALQAGLRGEKHQYCP